MRFEDRVLMAYAYGELSAGDAARIETALAEDPELAARVERFRSVRTALRKVYDSVAAEPVPERLRALLGDVALKAPEPSPPPIATRETVLSKHGITIPVAAWAVVAVALILGVLVGRLATPEPLFVSRDGVLRAGPQLARVLETRLAADETNRTDALRVGRSFLAGGDGVCRTFAEVIPAPGITGIGCRESEGWIIRFAASRGESDLAVMAMVDAMIDGEPLTAAEEAEARARNWRR